jgi:enamine deaminase RidA (YjgF/YER057c/UK114 family)
VSPATDVEDALFAAGCDAGTPNLQQGIMHSDFTRQTSSVKEAILSAIDDVRNTSYRRQLGVDAGVKWLNFIQLMSFRLPTFKCRAKSMDKQGSK